MSAGFDGVFLESRMRSNALVHRMWRGRNSPTKPALGPAGGAVRSAPLALDRETFRRAGTRLVERLGSFLAALGDGPVVRSGQPADLRLELESQAGLPAHGTDPEALLAETTELLLSHSLFNGHPSFFGYITSSPAPLGMLADLLAAALNANVGAWTLAPAATEIEAQTVRWLAELIGYPCTCGGLFVSGGNLANMVALFAARSEGGAALRRIYTSTETHAWLDKAVSISGLGAESICRLPVDAHGRIDLKALHQALDDDLTAGIRPLMVVATAGTVSTGAVDPLAELAELCRRRNIWFHVDGAYGAFAAAVPGTPEDLRCLHLADSVAIDPHKWLYAPIEAGCILVRDPEVLRRTFAHHPPYYEFGDETVNYHELGPQNSRGFRALKVWLALRQVGSTGYLRMIGDDIRLAGRLHRRVQEHPEFEALTLRLSISTFRFVPSDLRASKGEPSIREFLDTLNRRLLQRIQASGEAFVSNAVVDGKYALRACVVNFNTQEEHIDALPRIIARMGRELDREIRSLIRPQNLPGT